MHVWKCLVISAIAIVAVSGRAEAAILEWPIADGGNGHFYEQVDGDISWTDARDAATAKSFMGSSGYLATSTSAVENQFLVDHFDTFHHWIGGFQFDELAEQAGHWRWVPDEPWSYTNWFTPQEPNNSGGPEDFLVFVGSNTPVGLWQDWLVNGVFPPNNEFDRPHGYFVEYNPPFAGGTVVSEPSSLLLTGIGLVGLLGYGCQPHRSRI